MAVANVDGRTDRGKSEIIVAPMTNRSPQVRIYDNHANIKGYFYAYNQSFEGGVNIAAGDMDGDGSAEIITGAGPGGTPHVRVFKKNGLMINSFFADFADLKGGVKVGVVNLGK